MKRIKLLICLVIGTMCVVVPYFSSAQAVNLLKNTAFNSRQETQPVKPSANSFTDKVDFKKDVEPILRASCYACHGPNKQAAELRLDSAASIMKGGISGAVIVPGRSADSRLVHRVEGKGDEPRMPFKAAPLTSEQISLLRRWIDEGAQWPGNSSGSSSAEAAKVAKHWSFVAPVRPALPVVKNTSWVRNPVDAFVLARLEKENLSPSPEATKETLIRRVSLDLTGLPPTVREVETFLQDKSPRAYENLVDRLLGSPRYGERLASRWLDAARYADTNGYQVDGDRTMWPWRDWVVEAFNHNMPFDQFTVEQLAGDLLPNATLEQKIATGFNRNHRMNAEGGIVAEEYRVEYVVDRVDTTSTVFMGLTVGCARCHNHKFDPLTQKEYYQLSAYFNNIHEDGRAFDWGNSAPWISVPDRQTQQQLQNLEKEITSTDKQLAAEFKHLSSQQRSWEKTLATAHALRAWTPTNKLLVALTGDESSPAIINQSAKAYLNRPIKDQTGREEPPKKDVPKTNNDASKSGEKEAPKPADKPAALKPDTIGFKEGTPQYADAPLGRAIAFDGKLFFDAGRHADFRYKTMASDFHERFTLSTWVRPESDQPGAIITKMRDKSDEKVEGLPRNSGWGLFYAKGKFHFQIVRDWGGDGFRAETQNSFPAGEWHHVAVVFDGLKQYDDRVQLYVDGKPQVMKINEGDFYLYWGTPDEPLRIGAGGGPELRFRGALGDLRVYEQALEDAEIEMLACADTLTHIASLPAQQRSTGQKLKIDNTFIENAAPENTRRKWKQLATLREKKKSLEDNAPTVMVMEEQPQARPAFLLRRGSYDAPTVQVERGVPAILPQMPADYPRNRLGFARWLVSPQHPLTARVQVNRFWQMLFGTGLVKTLEDFGTQGERPSHPELLDWLAVEFRESGWDVKHLLKTIVMSATYRQSSKIPRGLAERDPENRLLARGPRFRLSAEAIRDQALYVSGLLVEKIGGPPVKPYQPDGLYKDMAFSNLTGYAQDKGEGLWRRSLYTYWKRTVLAPNMQIFDASTREFCRVRESRTNTPLQSLSLMNDVTYAEAARLLAERMIKEGGRTPAERLAWAFRTVTARRAGERELQLLLQNYNSQADYFAHNPPEAGKLLSVGERRNDRQFDEKELASYVVTASLILNLDEAITKQ